MKDADLTKAELAEIARRRQLAHAKARELADTMSPEEDARITAAAEADPDALPLTDDQLARMRPAHEVLPQLIALHLRRTNKVGSTPQTETVTLDLPPSVLEAYRATGPGWRTRMAEVLERNRPNR